MTLVTHAAQLLAATAPPTPNPTPVAGEQVPHTAVIGPGLGWVLVGFMGLMVCLVLTPILLKFRDSGFYRIPYITWWLLHYVISGLAILVIAVLGLSGTINGEVISALLGGVIGYVLGSASSRANQSTPATPSISTFSQLPPATVGTAYTQHLTATGGTSPFMWSGPIGSLPQGLQFNAGTGTIAGTPTAAGSSTFAINVTDSAERTSCKSFCLLVHEAAG
jgi:hypothetical protein